MRLNEMLKVNVFLDDLRDPPKGKTWKVLRTSKEAIDYVKKNGMPSYWSFDHDLGGDDTTMVFLKWLVDRDIESNGKIIPDSFHYDIHSANPVGAKNISGLLDNYLQFRQRNG